MGDALGALEGVLEGLEEGDTVNALLRGRLEDVRAALEQVLEQAGVDEGEGRVAIGESPSEATGEPT